MTAATYSLGCQPKRKGRDQHLKAVGPGGPATMEPAKGPRHHKRLCAS
jgi:hypothetical protein